MIDSVYRKGGNYYPTVFFEKYNFNHEIEIYSSDSYNVDSDEECSDSDYSDEENSDEKIQMKKIECINLFLEKTSGFISSHPEI